MRWRFLLAVCVTFVSPGPGVRADDQADARAIIDKAIEAAGGKEALAKYEGPFYCETKGKSFVGDKPAEFTDHRTTWLPDRLRSEEEILSNGKESTRGIVINRDKGWVKVQKGGSPPPPIKWEEIDANQATRFRDSAIYKDWVATLAPLTDSAFQLSTVDEIKVDDRPAVGVKVSHKDRPEVRLYFDKETLALVKLIRPAGETAFFEEVYGDDYGEVDGVVYPKKVVFYRNGTKTHEIEITKFEFIDPPPDECFDQP